MPAQSERWAIKERVGKILAAKKSNPLAETTKDEREIDEIVYEIHGFTKPERRIVEGDEMPHVAYGDDSGSSDRRYRCLALVSGPEHFCEELTSLLAQKLIDESIFELKFEEVRGHAPKMRAAAYFLKQSIEYSCRAKVRIDILLWDNYDSRHAVASRDDEANIIRMYYKNLVHISRQWKANRWKFFPDEQSGVDWNELRRFLNSTRVQKWQPGTISLFSKSNSFLDFESIVSRDSTHYPLIQLADLFGGLSRFSREKGREYINWLTSKEAEQQPGLFLLDHAAQSSDSKADEARFSLLREFDALCKKSKLGVSVKTRGFLWTPQPHKPIDFWPYEPQHDKDKAPTRSA